MIYVISDMQFSGNPIQVKTKDYFAFVDEISRMTRKSRGDVAYWAHEMATRAAESDDGIIESHVGNDTFAYVIAEDTAENANSNGLKLDEIPDIKELESIRENAAKVAIEAGKPAPCYVCGCFEPELSFRPRGRLTTKCDLETLTIECPRCGYKTSKNAVYYRGQSKDREAAVESTRKELIQRWNQAWFEARR